MSDNVEDVLKPMCVCVCMCMYIYHHHHVLEGLGMLACSLILKMKLVPPSLPRSSYVSSSVVYIYKLLRKIVHLVVLSHIFYLKPFFSWGESVTKLEER